MTTRILSLLRPLGLVGLLWAGIQPSLAADTLRLELASAVDLALQYDAGSRALAAQAAALANRAIAADTLPDPQLKLGAVNVPDDTWNFDQVPMTQLQLGVRQMFPSWGSLDAKSSMHRATSDSLSAKQQDRQQQIRRDTRNAWLELFYWQAAKRLVLQSKRFFKQLVRITELQYAAGRSNQQDVLRAELEYGLLEDREHSIYTRIENARAGLTKLTGIPGEPQLPEQLPTLPVVPESDQIRAALGQHPALQSAAAMINNAHAGVDLARARHRPGVNLDLTYGKREGRYADGRDWENLVSASVIVDLPLFTGKRQGKLLTAAQQELAAAQQQQEERKRMLERTLDQEYASWIHLEHRLSNYDTRLLAQANGTAEAALRAYQNNRAQFTDLMRARILELDTQLKALRLRVDRAKTQANLLYLAGERP